MSPFDPQRLDPERDPAHPSRRALEEAAFGGPSTPLDAHLAACPVCAEQVAELRQLRERFNAARPPAVFAARLFAEAERSAAERDGSRAGWRGWFAALARPRGLGVAGVLLTAALVLVVVRSPPPSSPGAADIRLKGAPAVDLEILVSRAGAPARPRVDGRALRAGDVLRFAIDVPRPGFVLVVNLDDRGRYSRYVPAEAKDGLRVEAGADQILPGSVELDEFVGKERIFLVHGEQPLDDARVRRAVEQAYQKAGGDLERIPPLNLEADVTSVLVVKEAS